MNKDELKEQLIAAAFEEHKGTYHVRLEDAFEIIDQLDEPETLSQEWIDENEEQEEMYGTYGVPVRKLQNLLVPKQEERVNKTGELKPVVPQFVAEWIEKYKPVNSLRVAFIYIYELPREDTFKIWIENGMSETFARDWLDGYEVEKEQKYILSINITDKASKTSYETFLNKRGIFHSMENESFNSEEFNWTEEEIKGLESGEILFEHFATKVGELEE